MSRRQSIPDSCPSDEESGSDDSDDYESANDNDNDEDIQEDDDLIFYPICCRTTTDRLTSYSTLAEAVAADLRKNTFDLLRHLPSATNEQFFEKAIVCINKSRTFVSSTAATTTTAVVEGEALGKRLTEYLDADLGDNTSEEEEEEKYFRPLLADDAFLLCMDDLQDLCQQRDNTGSSSSLDGGETMMTTATEGDVVVLGGATNEELQMRIASLEEQLTRAKACITLLAVDETDATKQPAVRDNDTYYFNSYSHSSIHEVMLQDRVRTNAYRDAILSNATALFKDKIVIDLGCGTGILSLFAAKAGAKKVIAIDASDIYTEATEIVHLNGYSDVITVVHGKVEDLIAQQKLPLGNGEKANVIISEWMGYALFFETMLPSVLTLRDACMDQRDGMGTMFPNGCSILLEGATDLRLDFWDDVYGMDMHPMKTRVAKEMKNDMNVEIVQSDTVVTDRILLKDWNLNKCSDKELDFEVPFELKIQEGKGDTVRLDKLVISFDIAFDLPDTTPVYFSTGCQSEPTHWKQTTMCIDPLNGSPVLKAGEVMKGTFQMGKNKSNHRDMDFLILWEIGSFLMKEDKSTFTRRCGGTIVNSLTA